MVDWEDPGGRMEHTGAWREEAIELKTKPNVWGVIAAFPATGKIGREDKGAMKARGLASSINRGLLLAYRPVGSFKAVSRLKDGEYKVYAMYLGEEEEW